MNKNQGRGVETSGRDFGGGMLSWEVNGMSVTSKLRLVKLRMDQATRGSK